MSIIAAMQRNKMVIGLCCAIFLSCVLLNILGLYSQDFFRDWSIVFEGGYRMYLGQLPYRDFFLPIGPVTFFMQSLFNHLFGVGATSMAIHAGSLTGFLCVLFFLRARHTCGMGLSLVLTLSLFVSYIGLHSYPWYNHTSYFFLYLLALFLMDFESEREFRKPFLFLAAILTALAFFSKQDTGLLLFFFYSIYLWTFSQGKSWEKPAYYALYFLGIVGGCFLLFSTWGEVFYWFNLKQAPHSNLLQLDLKKIILLSPLLCWGAWNYMVARGMSTRPLYWAIGGVLAVGYGAFCWMIWNQSISDYRIYLIDNILFGWKLLVCVAAFLMLSFYHSRIEKKQLALMILLNAVLYVTAKTSGVAKFTIMQGIPFTAFLFFSLLRPTLERNGFTRERIRALTVLVLCVFQPLITIVPNYLNSYAKFQSRIEIGVYRNVPLRSEAVGGLATLREAIDEEGGDFFNLSEYTFLYADYQVTPPSGVPLWFDEGTSWFKRDVERLIVYIESHQPSLILLQDAFAHTDLGLHQRLITRLTEELSYEAIGTVAAANADAPITLLRRIDQ